MHTLGQIKDNGKNEKKFEFWYKKLNDTKSKIKETYLCRQEKTTYLKKLNYLKSVVEGILKNRKNN